MNLCYNTASNIFFALCNYGIFFFFFLLQWRFNLTLPAATTAYFILIMFSIKTLMRNTEWWDTEYLAQAGMRTNPLNAKMFMTMGNVLAQKVS